MKERLANVLAWGAFFWALNIVFLLASGVISQPHLFFQWPFTWASPVTWLVLYVLTGSPRILPWKQVTDDD